MSRVLIVDDHRGFRRLARSLLQAEGLNVVGEASDEASAVAAVKELRPGVVLLPGRDGFAIAVELRALDPELAIVLTSSRPADEWGARLAAPPVDGFVHKDDLSASALTQVLG